jgi:hypothetical protein
MSEETGRVSGKQTATYRIWAGMKTRCLNPRSKNFDRYGGRGIMVCKRWLDFRNFFVDMGPRPPGLELDRIDNDGPYDPSNCRWADRKTQCCNTSCTVFVDVDGRPLSLKDACGALGYSYGAVRQRIFRGASLEEALCPVRQPTVRDARSIASQLGVTTGTVRERIRNGWSVKDAISTPRTTRWTRSRVTGGG